MADRPIPAPVPRPIRNLPDDAASRVWTLAVSFAGSCSLEPITPVPTSRRRVLPSEMPDISRASNPRPTLGNQIECNSELSSAAAMAAINDGPKTVDRRAIPVFIDLYLHRLIVGFLQSLDVYFHLLAKRLRLNFWEPRR